VKADAEKGPETAGKEESGEPQPARADLIPTYQRPKGARICTLASFCKPGAEWIGGSPDARVGNQGSGSAARRPQQNGAEAPR
jgi:hypothetical protein